MSEKQRHLDAVTLANLRRGTAVELWQHEFARVLDNIADPNTDPCEARQITLKITVRPDETRDAAHFDIECKANKLAGVKTAGGTVHFGRRNDELVAVEYDPKQVDMFDQERGADVVPLSKAVGDDE